MAEKLSYAPGGSASGAFSLSESRNGGRLAYVLLWFPLASETFIFREVMQLREKGFPLSVYTLYGTRPEGQSAEMLNYSGPLTHIGPKASFSILAAFFRQVRKRPRLVLRLIREILLQRRVVRGKHALFLCRFPARRTHRE